MMKENIGIVTFHRAHNYGAILQVYALQKTLQKNNYNAFIVDYYDVNIYGQYEIFKKGQRNVKKKIKSVIRGVIKFYDLRKRYIKFNEFITRKLNLIDFDKINSLNILVTGSDQVWNTSITHGLSDIYTLNFGNGNQKRVSYAASIGNSVLENCEKSIYKDKLSGMQKISVREESAKQILDEILPQTDITVVLDPTLLLTKEDWDMEIQNISNEKEKYILAYVVEDDIEYRNITNYLSEKTGYKIIYFDKKKNYKNKLRSAFTDGPFEFVNLIKNAEYVVATSFHATVFSIIYNKKFFVVPHSKTGSRVTNLLEKLEIKGRDFEKFEQFKDIDINFETNWEVVNNNLAIERKKSAKWLTDAINEGEHN